MLDTALGTSVDNMQRPSTVHATQSHYLVLSHPSTLPHMQSATMTSIHRLLDSSSAPRRSTHLFKLRRRPPKQIMTSWPRRGIFAWTSPLLMDQLQIRSHNLKLWRLVLGNLHICYFASLLYYYYGRSVNVLL